MTDTRNEIKNKTEKAGVLNKRNTHEKKTEEKEELEQAFAQVLKNKQHRDTNERCEKSIKESKQTNQNKPIRTFLHVYAL